jgi:hypothetical protein
MKSPDCTAAEDPSKCTPRTRTAALQAEPNKKVATAAAVVAVSGISAIVDRCKDKAGGS